LACEGEEKITYVIAVLDSGNFALNLMSILNKKSIITEFTSLPCGIAKSGCGYCLKFSISYLKQIIKIGAENNLIIREVYEIVPQFLKNKYIKIYPAF
jgi:hypothetical protein